jgi:hypothetical protein
MKLLQKIDFPLLFSNMVAGVGNPQGRKLSNINNMPDTRYLTSINFTAEQIPDGERWGCAVDTNQLLYPDWSWLISGVGVAFV